MPDRKQKLFDDIASFSALLERELRNGTYRPGRYKRIEVFDPKHRVVSAAPFRDRVVHHAFCAVCEPIFERGFIDDSYANRKGKGTHRAVARYEAFRDRFRYVLRCDIYRYFPAIDHAILKRDLRRRIACAPTGQIFVLADSLGFQGGSSVRWTSCLSCGTSP